MIRIGIDIGGTFTDFVVAHPDGRLQTFKLLSTPGDPAAAVLQGLGQLGIGSNGQAQPGFTIVHGSTVATNALLERKGARTALVATRGFADLLQIGRQNRPALYDLFADPPAALVPPELRLEVNERVGPSGSVLQALDPDEAARLIPKLQAEGVDAVAVCLLFSFLRPEHEQAVAQVLRQAGFFTSISSEILPEFREYERASTTAVNAYVSPVLDRYLGRLETAIQAAPPALPAPPAGAPGRSRLRVMQSNGGSIRVAQARQAGVHCILSGPAGGVVGGRYLAALRRAQTDPAGPLRLLTFDMGGTSTDVALIDGEPQLTTEAQIGGCPLRIPLLDIHTIGAGGGSIARVDPGGALRVGPESAGADPGPACYGRGMLPTVTDANLALGRLVPERFLDGQMALEPERARQALETLGQALGLEAEAAALGVTAVAEAHMARALRVISVERGHDPRRFTLLSFGGAGGLHACGLARSLGIPQVLAPALASTLSAFGMLAADIIKDYAQTVMLSGETPLEMLAARLETLAERGRDELAEEGAAPEEILLQPAADLRCRGQSYEITVPFSPQLIEQFHKLHERLYGYRRPEAPVEIVTLRMRAIGRTQPPRLPELPAAGPDPAAALLGRRSVWLEDGPALLPLYRGEDLRPGNRIAGPALVLRADTAILIPTAAQAAVDLYGSLLISLE